MFNFKKFSEDLSSGELEKLIIQATGLAGDSVATFVNKLKVANLSDAMVLKLSELVVPYVFTSLTNIILMNSYTDPLAHHQYSADKILDSLDEKDFFKV